MTEDQDRPDQRDGIGSPDEQPSTAPEGPGPPPASAYGAYEEPAPPPRKRSSQLAILAIALVVLLGAGAAALFLRSAREEPSLATLVPADVPVFAKINLDPSDDQDRALRSLVGRLPAAQRDRLVPQIEDALDEAFEEAGLSYRRDVKPWVGDQIGFALTDVPKPNTKPEDVPFVVLITVEDESRARDTLTRARARTDQPFGFVVAAGVAYIAPREEPITKLRNEAKRATLAALPDLVRSLDRVGGEGLGYVWTDAERLAELTRGSAAFTPFSGGIQYPGRGVTVLRAESDGIVVRGYGVLASGQPVPKAGTPELVEATSAGLLGELTFFDLATPLRQLLQLAEAELGGSEGSIDDQFAQLTGLDLEQDVFAWMAGEVSIIVGGFTGGTVEAGSLIEVTDEDALSRTLAAIGQRLPAFGQATDLDVSIREDGLDLRVSGQTIAVRRAPGKLAIASTAGYAGELLRGSRDSLAEDVVYRRIVGGTDGPSTGQMFVRIDRIRSLVEGLLPSEARTEYDRDVAPYLSIFEAFGGRSTLDGNEIEFRFVLSVAER